MRFARAAAVLVVALIGDRRQELVQQVAVADVQLDQIEADARGALRRIDELLLDFAQAVPRQRLRRVPARPERQRGRRYGRPRLLVGASGLPPCAGGCTEPLRPACASWMPSLATP